MLRLHKFHTVLTTIFSHFVRFFFANFTLFLGGKCIEVDPNDYRIIMSKDWRRGGGILVNVNLANHKGQFAYDNIFKLILARCRIIWRSWGAREPSEPFSANETAGGSSVTRNDRCVIHERSRNPLQKRNPALTVFCFWINKYNSGILKNSRSLF